MTHSTKWTISSFFDMLSFIPLTNCLKERVLMSPATTSSIAASLCKKQGR